MGKNQTTPFSREPFFIMWSDLGHGGENGGASGGRDVTWSPGSFFFFFSVLICDRVLEILGGQVTVVTVTVGRGGRMGSREGDRS